ncbi:MAG: hypothetical protein ACREHD_07835 [Pirellulales bacterium]
MISPDDSPDEVAALHENASRLHLAIRGLNLVEQRVVKLVMAERSLREIAATFGHVPHWAQAHFDAAARHVRRQLLKPHARGTAVRELAAAQ